MARARGANALMALAFAPIYGAIPDDGFRRVAFSAHSLGDEQGLVEDDLLGYGRNPLPPSEDVINNRGDVTVPVDLRLFGLWLKLMFGPPQTTQGVAAKGSITFANNPAVNDTITIGGQAFTFKAASPGANQILIGSTLAETIRNAVWALNASAVAGVKVATYATDLNAKAILVTHDTIGTAGNAMTIAASAATASGATLAGGSTAGPYNHVFTAGATELPDAAIEIGNPEVPRYAMNYGVMANTLAISLARSGNLNAVLGLIAQGESLDTESLAGDVDELEVERFSQFSGLIAYAGVPLGNIVSGQLNVSNNLDPAEVIRPDGRIDGSDPGKLSVTPQITSRFADNLLMDIATSDQAINLTYGWSLGAGKSLTFDHKAVRLPKPKLPISGPGGIQATFGGQGHRDITGKTLVVTLVNDVADYD